MNIPTLTTDRLVLMPPHVVVHTQLYVDFYTDPDASASYSGPLSADGARARLAQDVQAWHTHGFGVWVICTGQEQQPVGVCGFWQGNGWPRELTWWLLPQARGKGFAQEASFAVVEYAYSGLGWERVETYMNDTNESARNLVLRLKGIKTGRRVFPDGLERNVYCIPAPNQR